MVQHQLQVTVSAGEWSNAHNIRDICKALARYFRAKPAHERAAIEAKLKALNIDQYNAPPPLPPRKW